MHASPTLQHTAELPALIRARELAAHYGIHRSTLWQWVQQGRHPKPTKLSSAVVVWRREQVEDFLRAREAAR